MSCSLVEKQKLRRLSALEIFVDECRYGINFVPFNQADLINTTRRARSHRVPFQYGLAPVSLFRSFTARVPALLLPALSSFLFSLFFFFYFFPLSLCSRTIFMAYDTLQGDSPWKMDRENDATHWRLARSSSNYVV